MATQMTVWRPFADFGELRQRVEEMFREAGIGTDGAWTPSVDVLRKNGDVILRADLPGITPEEVKVTVEDDVLTVSGEHTDSAGDHSFDRFARFGVLGKGGILDALLDFEAFGCRALLGRDGFVDVGRHRSDEM